MDDADPSEFDNGAASGQSDDAGGSPLPAIDNDALGQRLRDYLRAASPNMYCDECLRRDAGVIRIETLRRLVQSAVSAGSYLRGIGVCATCKRAKTVTRVNSYPHASSQS